MSDRLTIRYGHGSDTPAIANLCKDMVEADYVPQAWQRWADNPESIVLVAELDAAVVGCICATGRSADEVFAQALRVDALVREQRIATRLIERLTLEMQQRGILTLFATMSPSNNKIRQLLTSHPSSYEGEIIRRRRQVASLRQGQTGASIKSALCLLQQHQALASFPALALYRRFYFSPTDRYLMDAIEQGRCLTKGDAIAVVDKQTAGGDYWIGTMAGDPKSINELLTRVIQFETKGEPGVTLTIDAPADHNVQASLDELGFEGPDLHDHYLIIRVPVAPL